MTRKIVRAIDSYERAWEEYELSKRATTKLPLSPKKQKRLERVIARQNKLDELARQKLGRPPVRRALELKVQLSRIRVQLSRPLTESETEYLLHGKYSVMSRLSMPSGIRPQLTCQVAPNREHVWLTAAVPSRTLYNVLDRVVATVFVNVFPRAVRTFTEYNGPS